MATISWHCPVNWSDPYGHVIAIVYTDCVGKRNNSINLSIINCNLDRTWFGFRERTSTKTESPPIVGTSRYATHTLKTRARIRWDFAYSSLLLTTLCTVLNSQSSPEAPPLPSIGACPWKAQRHLQFRVGCRARTEGGSIAAGRSSWRGGIRSTLVCR